MSSCQCLFRVWVSPADPPNIEVWYHGLEGYKPLRRLVSEWFADSFSDYDMHDLFSLDKESHYQVLGKATLTGTYDYFGDYDEDLEVDEFTVSAVPAEFIARLHKPLPEE